MCIDNERLLSTPSNKVRWVWKRFRKEDKGLQTVLKTIGSVWNSTNFPKGTWLTAEMDINKGSSIEFSPGFHAYGTRKKAKKELETSCYVEVLKRVRVRGVIAENANGDVRAMEMFIPKGKKR